MPKISVTLKEGKSLKKYGKTFSQNPLEYVADKAHVDLLRKDGLLSVNIVEQDAEPPQMPKAQVVTGAQDAAGALPTPGAHPLTSPERPRPAPAQPTTSTPVGAKTAAPVRGNPAAPQKGAPAKPGTPGKPGGAAKPNPPARTNPGAGDEVTGDDDGDDNSGEA